MRTFQVLLAIAAALVVAPPPFVSGASTPVIDEVNVFTGTSNSRWMLFPGATQPFGLVKLSPDNQGNVWNGGYEYTVGSISGFSHLHAFSLSGLSVMPVTGKMEYNFGLYRVFADAPDGPFNGIRSVKSVVHIFLARFTASIGGSGFCRPIRCFP